jgi:hypothetical protein
MSLCNPSLFYLLTSLLAILFSHITNPSSFLGFLLNLVVVFLITYALNYICTKYSVNYSWGVLIAFYVIWFIIFSLYMASY